jgi:hypothetical protein
MLFSLQWRPLLPSMLTTHVRAWSFVKYGEKGWAGCLKLKMTFRQPAWAALRQAQ